MCPSRIDEAEIELTRERCRSLARAEGAASPLYSTLLECIADDDEVCALRAEAGPSQRRPVLLLAAIHDLLLAGSEHELAEWYPTCGGRRSLGARFSMTSSTASSERGDPAASRNARGPGDARAPGDAGSARDRARTAALSSTLRSFVLDQSDAIRETLATRSTQTNEVGRSTALLLALGEVARRSGGRPLHLLELGASAGLNLIADRYHHQLVHHQLVHHQLVHHQLLADDDAAASAPGPFGISGSPVQLRPTIRGEPPRVSASGPVISARSGLDLHPLDVTMPRDLRWLRACVWPDQAERHAQLNAAAEVMTSDPVRVAPGDMLSDIDSVLAGGVGDGLLVVWHSWALTYVPRERRHLLAEQLRSFDEVWWLSAEHPGTVAELGEPKPTRDRDEEEAATQIGAIHLSGGRTVSTELWGRMHAHGRWLRWHPSGSASSPG